MGRTGHQKMAAGYFEAWLSDLGRGSRPISDEAAARMLSIRRDAVAKYRTGECPMTRRTALASAALALGPLEWQSAA